MVAAIKSPKTLDPARLAFIQEKIFGNNSENKSVTITKREEVNIPKVKQPVRFRRKKPIEIIIEKITE